MSTTQQLLYIDLCCSLKNLQFSVCVEGNVSSNVVETWYLLYLDQIFEVANEQILTGKAYSCIEQLRV